MKEGILRAIAYFKHKIEYESVFLFDNEITNFETAVKILQEHLENDPEKTDELIGDMGMTLADLRDENKELKAKLKELRGGEDG